MSEESCRRVKPIRFPLRDPAGEIVTYPSGKSRGLSIRFSFRLRLSVFCETGDIQPRKAVVRKDIIAVKGGPGVVGGGRGVRVTGREPQL